MLQGNVIYIRPLHWFPKHHSGRVKVRWMLRGAELVIGGTRLNKAGYPQQNPALKTEIVRKKLSLHRVIMKLNLFQSFPFISIIKRIYVLLDVSIICPLRRYSRTEMVIKTAHLSAAFSTRPVWQVQTFTTVKACVMNINYVTRRSARRTKWFAELDLWISMT